MKKILLFVHGTGVRQPGYNASFSLIERKLVEHKCVDVVLVDCYWGDRLGAKLPDDCKSVPGYGTTRAIGAASSDSELEIWDFLTEDPHFELRLLPQSEGKIAAYPLNEPHPGILLEKRFSALVDNTDLLEAARHLGLQDSIPFAIKAITSSRAFAAAGKSRPAGSPQHRIVLARAIVAMLQHLALDLGAPVFDGAYRDGLVEKVDTALGGDVRGIFGTALTAVGRAYRGTLTSGHHAKVGDILRYQARGEEWHHFINERIAQYPNDKVILFAHSLGGIAAFETLLTYKPPNVVQLITFGSQAPFLYEIDALARIRRGEELPDEFPMWSNFYDANDPLSYLTRGLFDSRVNDNEVQSGQSMLAAHSAYLQNHAFWQLVSSKIACA